MDVSLLTDNAIIYVLAAWVIILFTAKLLRLERRGVDLKFYSLVYKNRGVQSVLVRVLGRTRRGVRILADVSVVAGFAMMGFAFWFLINNLTKFFVEPSDFAVLTVLIPGVTLTSAPTILYFLLSIPIVLVMHEGAHGIVAALEKIRIKTGGFAIFIALFAGFVEPDEDEFNNAKKISKLRVIGAGATANVAFALAMSIILLTNPVFALILPEPLLSTFYEQPDEPPYDGVLVASVMEGYGAEAAGIMPNDIITAVNGIDVDHTTSFDDLGLAIGDTASVQVLRNDQPMRFDVEIFEAAKDLGLADYIADIFDIETSDSAEEPGRALVGITRDTIPPYDPVLDFIVWDNHQLSMFLIWLWMISFFIGIINMLPLPILDGGKFVQIIIEGRTSEDNVNRIMWAIYGFTFAIFALNIALSYALSGWITI